MSVRYAKVIYALAVLAFVLAWHLPVFLGTGRSIAALTGDDRPLEWSGSVACLIGAVLFFLAYAKSGSSRARRNVFFLLLGLLVFVAFGEEISWGQRILRFATPEVVASGNYQQEFNVHNMSALSRPRSAGLLAWLTGPQALFTLFWLTYGLLIPVLFKVNSTFGRLARRINLPIVPIWLGIGFWVNTAIWLYVASYRPTKGNIEEFTEGAMEILIALVAGYFLSSRASGQKTCPEG